MFTTTYKAFGNCLPYATGSNLDFLCQIYGVTRLPGVDASSDSSDNNFQFYVLSGTFGAINNGQPIEVPSGTLIYTQDPNGPVMQVAGDVTLNPGDSVQQPGVFLHGRSKISPARLAAAAGHE